ncbi:MAG: cytochrome c peroxidase [Aureliella sp.]
MSTLVSSVTHVAACSMFLASLLLTAGSATAAEKVVLGSDELTSGIPGDGPLTLEQASKWFNKPHNQQQLEVELPSNLAGGKDALYIPADNPLTRAKIELGRQLYFEPRLSRNSEISCADCHHPTSGWAKETQFGVGVEGQTGNRNSPTSFNRILSREQFWDGRADSLEAQAVGPIANPVEMSSTHDVAVKFVSDNPIYRFEFEEVFGHAPNIDDIGRALAAFERVVVTGPAAYDAYEELGKLERAFAEDLEDLQAFEDEEPELFARYKEVKQASEAQPMGESAIRGRKLFFSTQANCAACHVGVNFTDEKYHNLGVGMKADEPDLGRFVVSGEEKDKGAFKTPSLRNIAQTGPYMHDGSQRTLREVVDWYAQGGHPNPTLSDKIKKFEASEQDRQDLVAFMQALTGEFPKVEVDRLPE